MDCVSFLIKQTMNNEGKLKSKLLTIKKHFEEDGLSPKVGGVEAKSFTDSISTL